MEQAGVMCALGLPGWKYVSTEDPTDKALLFNLLKVAVRFREQERKALATDIVNTLAKSIKGGKKKKGSS